MSRSPGGSPLELAARIAISTGGPRGNAGRSLVGCPRPRRRHGARLRGAGARQSLLRTSKCNRHNLSEFVTLLTAKEIERPGIAGPFFSGGTASGWRTSSNVPGFRWRIGSVHPLERRYPETGHPAVQQRDRLRPRGVRRSRRLRAQTPRDGTPRTRTGGGDGIDHRVEDMEPILVELGDSADAGSAGALRGTLLSLSTAPPGRRGAGFVAGRALPVTRIYSSTSSIRWTACTMRTRRRSFRRSANHSGATAAAMLEIVLPQSMRGDLLPYGLPGDGGEPRCWHVRPDCQCSIYVRRAASVSRRRGYSALGLDPRHLGGTAGAWRRKIALNRPPWWALNKHGSRTEAGNLRDRRRSRDYRNRRRCGDIRNRRRRQ